VDRPWLALGPYEESNGAGVDTDLLDTAIPEDPDPATARLVELVPRGRHAFPELLMVGRSIGADVVIRSPWVSVTHAVIYFDKKREAWLIRETERGSTNGTTVSGMQLEEGQALLLSDGCRISFGGIVALFFESRATLSAWLGHDPRGRAT